MPKRHRYDLMVPSVKDAALRTQSTGELREPPAMTMCKAASAVAKMTLRLAKSLKNQEKLEQLSSWLLTLADERGFDPTLM
eukprot:symbB.v1.2.004268.t1/scaffold222.1/size270942/10